MHITDSYSLLHYTCRLIGIAPYETKTINNQKIVCKNKLYMKCTKIIYLYYLLFVCYNMQFVIQDIKRLTNIFSAIFYVVEICIGHINFLSAPIIFLYYLNLLCEIQNRLNKLFVILISEKNVKMKNLSKVNTFLCSLNVIFLILIFFCNVIDVGKHFSINSFFQNVLLGIIHVPVELIKYLPSLNYFALANVLKEIYSEINQIIKFKRKDLEISIIRNIDDFLKDTFQDINSVFSISILLGTLNAFLTSVGGTVLLITERGNILTLDFTVWVFYYMFYLITIIQITSLLAAEVSKNFY